MGKGTRVLRPVDARTFDQICELPRDGMHGKAWWMSLGPGSVTFAQQKVGEPSTGMVSLSRHDFDRLVRWYTTGRATKPTIRKPRAR